MIKKEIGFTLIELLVVVSVIGVLVGVTVNVIDGRRQKAVAQDSAKKTNLEKVCAGLQAYYQGEDSYPAEGDVNIPLHSTAANASTLAFYINSWPDGFIYNVDGNDFSIHVQKSVDENYFKCGTAWRTVQECASTTDANDVSSCNPIP